MVRHHNWPRASCLASPTLIASPPRSSDHRTFFPGRYPLFNYLRASLILTHRSAIRSKRFHAVPRCTVNVRRPDKWPSIRYILSSILSPSSSLSLSLCARGILSLVRLRSITHFPRGCLNRTCRGLAGDTRVTRYVLCTYIYTYIRIRVHRGTAKGWRNVSRLSSSFDDPLASSLCLLAWDCPGSQTRQYFANIFCWGIVCWIFHSPCLLPLFSSFLFLASSCFQYLARIVVRILITRTLCARNWSRQRGHLTALMIPVTFEQYVCTNNNKRETLRGNRYLGSY